MTTITNAERTAAIMTSARTTTMTNEHRPPKRESRLHVSSLELRLYVAALLAAVYTITWRAIGGHAPALESSIATAPTTSEPPRVVWIDRLPPAVRPTITLPAGWERASEPPASAAPPTRIVRAPDRRVPRVRTRSS
jgi:hypothetical protein